MSLRVRIVLLVGLFLVLLVGIGSWGVISTTAMQDRLLTEHDDMADAELAVVMAELGVREQVEGWKDILLNGDDEASLEESWQEFLEHERDVRKRASEALEALPTESVAAGLGLKFRRMHEGFGAAHRKALEEFRKGGPEAAERSNALVEGKAEELVLPLKEITRVLGEERTLMEPKMQELTLRRSISTMVAVVLTSLTAFMVLAVAMHRWMDLSILSAGRNEEDNRAVSFKAPKSPEAGGAAVAPRAWKRVVLAEEDDEARKALAEEMRSWNCEVLEAGSSTELARHLDLDGHSGSGPKPDAVVTSDSLPGVEAGVLVRWLKTEDLTRQIPLVVREANGGVLGEEERQLLAAAVSKSVSAGVWQREMMGILKNPPASSEAPLEWSVQDAFPRVGETRVLAAEDEPLNRKYLGLMLGKVGVKHEVVADGQEAVEAVEGNGFDVVLMDCGMPRLDGYEATRRIRETMTNGASPVVIGVTANTDDDSLRKCEAAGMDACVPKPVKLEYLCLVMEEELAKREAS